MVANGRAGPKHLGLLRATALIAVVAGAGGSIAFMLRVGQRNQSRLLLLVFAIWVLAPFLTLWMANTLAKRWPIPARAARRQVKLE